jgi:hypothetical protein
VRLPVRADRRNPAQTLPGEVAEFLVREGAYAAANRSAGPGIPRSAMTVAIKVMPAANGQTG